MTACAYCEAVHIRVRANFRSEMRCERELFLLQF